jgi:hypothetical protein
VFGAVGLVAPKGTASSSPQYGKDVDGASSYGLNVHDSSRPSTEHLVTMGAFGTEHLSRGEHL